MEIKERKKLPVTVDKRHIVSIGERLYAESVELLRELVNNAYDADATEVRVEIGPDRVIVRDDGSGRTRRSSGPSRPASAATGSASSGSENSLRWPRP